MAKGNLMKKILIFILISLFLVAIDLMSKDYFFYHPHTIGPVTSFLSVTLVKNKGVTFGIAQGYLGAIIAANLVLLALTFSMALSQKNTLVGYLWLAVFSGGLANLYDRIVLGYVRDFIHLHYKTYSWPVFNIADCFICLGVTMLVYFYSRQTSSDN